MINRELIAPESIVIIGGSNNTQKPGGKIIRNLLEGKFPGKLYAVNPKETEVQGIPCFPDITSLPNTELAILAVPAAACPSIVEELASTRNTKAFIIISAGFGEETHEGFLLEQEILKTANKYEASLIGPNCIGLMNRHHRSVFTLPIPELDSRGVDLISSSGATAVYIPWSPLSAKDCGSILYGRSEMHRRSESKMSWNILTAPTFRENPHRSKSFISKTSKTPTVCSCMPPL